MVPYSRYQLSWCNNRAHVSKSPVACLKNVINLYSKMKYEVWHTTLKYKLKINNHFSEPDSVSPTDVSSKNMVHCRIDPKLAISSVAVCVHRCSPPSCYNVGESREERWSEYGEECAGGKEFGKSRHTRLNGAGNCGFVLSKCFSAQFTDFWNMQILYSFVVVLMAVRRLPFLSLRCSFFAKANWLSSIILTKQRIYTVKKDYVL